MDFDDDDHESSVHTRSINLQDMCLTAFIRDIALFVNNKFTPQKHIDFLFRAYSDEIFSRHRALKNSIDEDCMLWFLNSHLKKVTVPHMFYSERIFQQLKVIGSGITSLSLENSSATENDLNSIISYLPHVVHINFSLTSCTNETLACMQKFCSNLESLIVSLTNVSDQGLENLCQGKLLLKKLNVLYCPVTAAGITKILDRIPSLECLLYDNLLSLIFKVGTTNDATLLVGTAATQYNLTELVYSSFPNIWDDNLDLKIIETCVKVCPRLKKLYFTHPVSEKVLSACAHLKNLEELKIKMSHSQNKAYDVLTPILPISGNLKTLILSCARISLVKLLENFRSLENLCLKKISFTPFEKKDIAVTKTKLLSLVIKDINMDDTAVQAITLLISLSKNVSKLYLKHIKYLPAEVIDATLNSMKNLTFVNFDSTDMDLHYANLFFEIPSMTTIIMNKNISIVESFRKSTSCTLSWRNMSDIEYNPEYNGMDEGEEVNKYYYHKNEDANDETDVISERCYSCDSDESDMSFETGSGSSFMEDFILSELYYSGDSDESDMSAENYSSDSDNDDKS